MVMASYEDLTMEDMDMYSMISERIVTDDVRHRILISYLMELNADQYSDGRNRDFVNFKNISTW